MLFRCPLPQTFKNTPAFQSFPGSTPAARLNYPSSPEKKQQQRGYLGKTLVFVPVAAGLIENKPRNRKMVFNLVLGIEHTFYEHLFGLIEHLFGLMLRFHEETQNRATYWSISGCRYLHISREKNTY